MKIDKQMQKKCISTIKKIAIESGYKKIQNTIYRIENENVISVVFLIVNSKFLYYRINIKKQSYDEIFWKIMKMEENINKAYSLRVNGAFIAPSVLIAIGNLELSENVDDMAKYFLEKINHEIDVFLKNNDIVKCIFSDNIESDEKILQCLSYIDLGLLTKAKELAKTQIQLGDKGRFKNEGKGFFELVLLYYD